MIEIFYDGDCIVCSTEILFYKRLLKDKLKIIDISTPDFKAVTFGIDPLEVNLVMHVRVDGKIYTKIEAFIKIWEILNRPPYEYYIKLARIKPIRFLMDIGYISFAKIRFLLPKRSWFKS